MLSKAYDVHKHINDHECRLIGRPCVFCKVVLDYMPHWAMNIYGSTSDLSPVCDTCGPAAEVMYALAK